MMRAAAAIAMLVGCGAPRPVRNDVADRPAPVDAAPARAPVTCGATTCGPDEYCERRCTCCGMRVADPSQASGTQTCKPLPPTCHGADGPECRQRVVDVPCA